MAQCSFRSVANEHSYWLSRRKDTAGNNSTVYFSSCLKNTPVRLLLDRRPQRHQYNLSLSPAYQRWWLRIKAASSDATFHNGLRLNFNPRPDLGIERRLIFIIHCPPLASPSSSAQSDSRSLLWCDTIMRNGVIMWH